MRKEKHFLADYCGPFPAFLRYYGIPLRYQAINHTVYSLVQDTTVRILRNIHEIINVAN